MRAPLTALLIVAGAPALAHDVPPDPAMPGHHWRYDALCCSNEDCAPAVPGQVVRAPEGWAVDGEVVPDGDPRIRPSGDTRFHACREMVPELRSFRKWRCLYVPGARS